MVFNSLHFLLFFLAVLSLLFMVSGRGRIYLLLLASCYFYAVFIPKYLLILFAVILIDYFAALKIETSRGNLRKTYLTISIATNLGILFFFKYWNFAFHNVEKLTSFLGLPLHLPLLEIILPIGLSFHTFQAMSYTIEVFRGAEKAEKDLAVYALYVLFFPQLVAGPIERPQNILHQFHTTPRFDFRRALSGLELIVWGLFKKCVIADRLTSIPDQVFADPHHQPAIALVAAVYAFTIQIYCDFSGYSDIARGAAQIMGYELMINFDRPYMSKSIQEFWRRWHISLSTWFRDYVYLPLGGNKRRKWLNALIVFVLSGLWHGANWTFVIWGAYHGILVTMNAILKRSFPKRAVQSKTKSRLIDSLKIVATFHLVAFGWIFFRAKSLDDAISVIKGILDFKSYSLNPLVPLAQIGWEQFDLWVAVAALTIMFIVHQLQEFGSLRLRLSAVSPIWRSALLYTLVAAVLLFGRFGDNQFIYFQF